MQREFVRIQMGEETLQWGFGKGVMKEVSSLTDSKCKILIRKSGKF